MIGPDHLSRAVAAMDAAEREPNPALRASLYVEATAYAAVAQAVATALLVLDADRRVAGQVMGFTAPILLTQGATAAWQAAVGGIGN